MRKDLLKEMLLNSEQMLNAKSPGMKALFGALVGQVGNCYSDEKSDIIDAPWEVVKEKPMLGEHKLKWCNPGLIEIKRR